MKSREFVTMSLELVRARNTSGREVMVQCREVRVVVVSSMRDSQHKTMRVLPYSRTDAVRLKMPAGIEIIEEVESSSTKRSSACRAPRYSDAAMLKAQREDATCY